MQYIHEAVTTESRIPAKVFINSVKSVQPHWHNSLEVLLALDGDVMLQQEAEELVLHTDDFIVVNSNRVHTLQAGSDKNLLLTVQFSKKFLKTAGIDSEKTEFSCCSLQEGKEEIFAQMRSLMAEIAIVNMKQEKFYDAKLAELLYKLLHMLSVHFTVPRKAGETRKEELERLTILTDEIQKNYSTSFSLNDAAKLQGLSRNYFAHFFKKHMGVTFLEYLNNVRLSYAYEELLQTGKSVTEIALDNGFANNKSFTRSFKEVFHQTPSAYRQSCVTQEYKKNKNATISYFDIEGVNKHQYLYRHLLKEEEKTILPAASYQVTNKVNTVLKGKKLRENLLELMTFGRASTGLTAQLQKQITMVQNDIGFKYARFHGILDDDMQVYHEEKGSPIFNFTLVEHLFDFLLSVKLKPFLEIGFMPKGMAKRNKSLWEGKSIISMPKSMQLWNELIEKLLQHCIKRYGIQEVKSWKFEIWNEPEYKGIMWNDSKEDFFALWNNTYKTIKNINSSFKVGGVSNIISTIWQGDWFRDFVYFCKTNASVPDFLTVHCYPLDGFTIDENSADAIAAALDKFSYTEANSQWEELVVNTPVRLSEDSSFLRSSAQKMQKELKKYNWEDLPVYLTEWNATTWQRDLTADTVFKNAFLVKNMMETLDTFAGVGYWTMFDYMEEVAQNGKLYHGGFGLVTLNGIKKAAYYGFAMAKKLGNILIEQDKNYSVFKSANGVQVLLYNYQHFDKIYCGFDSSGITDTERYNVFEGNVNLQCNLLLQMEEHGVYNCTECSVSRENGSSFDEWVRMGAPAQLTREEEVYLNGVSVPKIRTYSALAQPTIELKCNLKPHEVCLISISK